MGDRARLLAVAAATVLATAAVAWWWSRPAARGALAEGPGAGPAEGFASSPLVFQKVTVRPLAARADDGTSTPYSRAAERRVIRNMARARAEAMERGAAQ